MDRKPPGIVLGVIPARGGSKGILKKNIAPLANKPLIQHTFEAALGSNELDMVILTTDDAEIAEVGRDAGVEVPFLRPDNLATDTSPSVLAIEHAVAWLEENRKLQIGSVMVLQPTSPLRQSWHIDEAVEEYRRKSPDAVISVSAAAEHPYDMVSFVNGRMDYSVPRSRDGIRRQDFPEFFFINGAIYLVNKSVLIRQRTLLPVQSIPYVMDRRYSLDIDSRLDLQIAESLLAETDQQGQQGI